MWNEQNYAIETGGTVDVAKYLPILKAGYNAIKARDRNITVVFGGMTPTGTNKVDIAIPETDYLKQFYVLNGGEGKRYYDVLGAHPARTATRPTTSTPRTRQPAHAATTRTVGGGLRRITRSTSSASWRCAR